MSDVRMWPSHWPLLMSWSLVVTHQPCWLSLRSVLASAECYICRLSESQWPMSRCQTVECYPSVFFPGPKESAGRVLRDWWETAERQLKDNCLRQGRELRGNWETAWRLSDEFTNITDPSIDGLSDILSSWSELKICEIEASQTPREEMMWKLIWWGPLDVSASWVLPVKLFTPWPGPQLSSWISTLDKRSWK